MEGKVMMFDVSGAEIGETYTRRARQLVKQQRAVWADDTHTAIRFMPDTAGEWEPEPAPAASAAPAPKVDRSGSILYAMAERRMRDRTRVIIHSLFLIPVFIFIPLFWGGLSNWRMSDFAMVTMGIAWGAWIMSYICHLRNYVKGSGYSTRPASEARRKLMLDVEVDRLRRMGYTE